MKFKVGDTVTCIREGVMPLTEGKSYEIRGFHGDLLITQGDDGKETMFLSTRFTLNEAARVSKINQKYERLGL